jgi:hypothetical protein
MTSALCLQEWRPVARAIDVELGIRSSSRLRVQVRHFGSRRGADRIDVEVSRFSHMASHRNWFGGGRGPY